MKAAKSAIDFGCGSPPRRLSLSCSSGVARPSFTTLLILATMSGGVPAGATMACQESGGMPG